MLCYITILKKLSNAYCSQLTTSPLTCIQQGSADANKKSDRSSCPKESWTPIEDIRPKLGHILKVRVWNSDMNDFETSDSIDNLLDSGQKTKQILIFRHMKSTTFMKFLVFYSTMLTRSTFHYCIQRIKKTLYEIFRPGPNF